MWACGVPSRSEGDWLGGLALLAALVQMSGRVLVEALDAPPRRIDDVRPRRFAVVAEALPRHFRVSVAAPAPRTPPLQMRRPRRRHRRVRVAARETLWFVVEVLLLAAHANPRQQLPCVCGRSAVALVVVAKREPAGLQGHGRRRYQPQRPVDASRDCRACEATHAAPSSKTKHGTASVWHAQ